jgi:Domain of unknown function (DUF4148)
LKPLVIVTLSLAALASSSVFAQSKTRAEVYQELIEAQQNGLNYVTDASYPDVSPVYAQFVERMKAQRLASHDSTSKTADSDKANTHAN